MGGACCVAARDRNMVSRPASEIVHRNIRHSPTWSLRWDNRGRVAGEDTSISWFSDGISRNSYASEEGSPIDSFRRRNSQKSATSEGTITHVRTPGSDQSISRNMSVDTSLELVKGSTECSVVSIHSSKNVSASRPSTSSLSTSPLSSQSQSHPTSVTLRWRQQSAGCKPTGQASKTRIPGLKSSNSFSVTEERPAIPSWGNESTRGSHGGSSDSWSMQAFSDLMSTSHGQRLSFDNDCLGFNQEKTRSSTRSSTSASVDLQTCGICSKLLSEKSLWSGQRLVVNNELPTVAVLTCVHVYHADCLETLTPESDKFCPACPVCTLGEKQTFKLSQKALKAEMDLKAKNKRLRNRVVDSGLDGDSLVFDRSKSSSHERKKLARLVSSSSIKISLAKPFLRKHFSFGSEGSKPSVDNLHTPKKKGFFWSRSVKA